MWIIYKMAYHHQSNKNCYNERHSQTFSSQEREKFGYLGTSSVSPFAGPTHPEESNNYVEFCHPGSINQNLSFDGRCKHYLNSNCALSFPYMEPNKSHLHQSSSISQNLETYPVSLPHSENSGYSFDLSKNLKQEDVSFLATWMNNIEKQNEEKQIKKFRHGSKNLKISVVQNAFMESNQLIMELELIYSRLSSNNSTDAECKYLVQKAEQLKIHLEEIKSFISDITSNGQLKEIIKERRNKRIRAKIKKKQRKEKYLRHKKLWKEKEEKIDVWQKKMHDIQKAILQDQEVQKSADSILHEVRTKQEEAQEIKNLVIALRDLREIRLKKGEIHGFIAKSDDSQIFENMSADLIALIKTQLKQYGLEEQTLRVMMENTPSVLPDKSHLLNISTRSKEELKIKIYEILFGENIPVNKLNAQQRYFLASEESFEILIKRRSSWDKYLADEYSPASIATAVPLGWVIPPSKPNLQWKKYHEDLH